MTILYKKRWTILITVLALLVFMLAYRFSAKFNNLVNDFTSKVLKQGYNLGSDIFNVNDQQIDALVSERDQLKSQVNSLTQQFASQERRIKESDELRKLLKIKEDDKYSKVVGYVVGKDADLSNSLVINLGSEDGVQHGDLVLSGEGVAVGTVLEANKNHSIILLLTDQQVKIPVSRVGESEAIGLTSGQFGLSVMVEMIPQTEIVNEGDVLVTSDAGQNLPGSIVIGTVKRILSEENKLFKEAIIDLAADFNNLKIIAVLIKK